MERQRDEPWNGGKFPATRDSGLALSEFANDADTSSRTTTHPPAGPADRGRDITFEQARGKAAEIAHDYRDYIAIASGIVIGVVAARLLLSTDCEKLVSLEPREPQ